VASHIAPFEGSCTPDLKFANSAIERKWFAVFTMPQNEKSALRHLEMRDVETFLPTYESQRIWKNRQRKKCVLPLFPCYLFVRVCPGERGRVLQAPGVLQIVGNGRHSVPLEDAQVEFLRSGFHGKSLEPYNELVRKESGSAVEHLKKVGRPRGLAEAAVESERRSCFGAGTVRARRKERHQGGNLRRCSARRARLSSARFGNC